jgi:hypothetical protein
MSDDESVPSIAAKDQENYFEGINTQTLRLTSMFYFAFLVKADKHVTAVG